MSRIKANDPKYIGKKYGKLTVEGFEHNGVRWLWKCRCDCGNTTVAYPYLLIHGRQMACHCGKRDNMLRIGQTHGKSHTRLYEIWCGMKKRCYNEKSKPYHLYGARGIKVCDEWATYPPFEEWALSHGYADDLSIERIDFNGNYEPSNCKWIPLKAQAVNRRSSRFVTIDGEKHTLREWVDIMGLNYPTIYSRVYRGHPQDEVIKAEYAKWKGAKNGVC